MAKLNIPYDKTLHLIAGFLIGLIFGFWLAVAAGISKEIYDHVSGEGTSEVMDAVATAFGGLLAVGLEALL